MQIFIGKISKKRGDQTALQKIRRKKPILANRVDPVVENAVVQHAMDQPS